MTLRHRLAAAALAMFLGACAFAGTSGATGRFALAAVDGAALPQPSPEPGIVLHSGALELRGDGGYTLDLVGSAADGTPDARRVYGTYRLRGSSLVLTPNEVLAEPVRYAVRRGKGVLHLTDDAGTEFTFVRR